MLIHDARVKFRERYSKRESEPFTVRFSLENSDCREVLGPKLNVRDKPEIAKERPY